ncbi:PIN domain-containing protein [Streptomyces sp. NPDC001982]|uniref:PIN domain-containing protein n=1 Tax=Streptomyces sp. NPDC001982 TaxID=3154405 RepID=UPI0033277AA7
MIVIGDTSGLVAAFNNDDPEHEVARRAFREASTTVISPLVFAEIEHIITRNIDRKTAHVVQDWLLQQERSMRVLVPEVSAAALRTARNVQDRYAELKLGLADSVNVVLAEQYETDTVLTLDRRDFRAIRPLTRHPAFRLLPDDL